MALSKLRILIGEDSEDDLLVMLEALGSHSYQPTYQMNLLVNSRDPMPGGDRLTIRAENIHRSDRNAKMNLDAKVGAYTLLIQESASRRK